MSRDVPPEKITAIQIATADACQVTVDGILSGSRIRNVAYARHLAMWLCRNILNVPYVKIGLAFGGRDHSTVIKGIHNCELVCQRAAFYHRTREFLVGKLSAEANGHP